MRVVQRFTYFALSLTLIGLCLFSIAPVQAQDESTHPAPQFLYRDDTRLILVDGYTGETTELPFEVTMMDRFVWSPDGRYLLTWIHDENDIPCLNLFDVDALEWLYDEPIACGVYDAIFSGDGAYIVYTTSKHYNGILWLYSVEGKTSEELYRTTGGNETYFADITDIQWSSTAGYLTFVDYRWIMGGTRNVLVVLNIESRNIVTILAPDTYYASYSPVWSEDDRWFLIKLREEYVTSGTIPFTNHQGDIYLVNPATGSQFRLTYTPAVAENDVRWTVNGGITFTVTEITTFNFTLDEAMHVSEVAAEDIVWPEPVDTESLYNPVPDSIQSPDPKIGAWKTTSSVLGETRTVLTLGVIAGSREPRYSFPLSDSHYFIGWRPSDYPYAQG